MKKGVEKRVVISTIYEGHAVKQAIIKLSPDKLILLIDEPIENSKKDKMNKTIQTLKEFFKNSFEIKTKKISSYDIPQIMQEVIGVIEEEASNENKIYIHVTEGRKPTSFALLFASYRKKDKIEGAFYITEEEHKLIKLPMLDFDINETKKSFLREIKKGNGELKELQNKINLKQSATYQNIQELKKEEYIETDGELRLTKLGEAMIL